MSYENSLIFYVKGNNLEDLIDVAHEFRFTIPPALTKFRNQTIFDCVRFDFTKKQLFVGEESDYSKERVFFIWDKKKLRKKIKEKIVSNNNKPDIMII